jgi:trk system potassium uptake protein TrkH
MKTTLSPPRALAVGFMGLILVGTMLLMLPLSANGGCGIIDAFFTATSAVCVTGLVVKDTPVDFTVFGQIVIMILIQLGGLGYMTSATIIPILVGKKIGLGERVLMKEALNTLSVEGIVRFTKAIFKITFIAEAVGAVILGVKFSGEMGIVKGMYYGLFHSISAFNNAGFSLFSDSLIGYADSYLVNATVAALIIFGGIGFFVYSDLYKLARREVTRLTIHTKIVIVFSIWLIIAGAAVFMLFEFNNYGSVGMLSTNEQVASSLFTSVTARTAGFTTVDFSVLRKETLFLIMLLMFIGASPGSTGGGIKVTTFATIMASLWITVRGKQTPVLFNRAISDSLVLKAFMIVALSSIFISLSSLLVLYLEESSKIEYLFEVVSAFGTVGLSVGDGGARSLSALFSPAGKIIIAITMFAGRLGPLTLAFAMIQGEKERVRYPEGKVIIG